MKRWLCMVLMAAVMLSALTMGALAADPVTATLENGITLELNTATDEWTVTGYNAAAGDVAKTGEIEIPAHHENLLVTSIKDNAFTATADNNFGQILKTVIIPGTLRTVGQNAFKDCKSLETVTFLDYVVGTKVERNTIIGAKAFEGCNALENLTLSCNIQKIEMDAFKNCSRLESLVIPKLVDEIRPGAFAGCTHLEDVTFLDVDTKFYFGNNSCAFPTGSGFPARIHCMEKSSAYQNAVDLLGEAAAKEVVHFITNVTDIKNAVTKEATCTSKGEIKIAFTCPAVTKEVPVTNPPTTREDPGDASGGGNTPTPPTTQTVKVPCSYYTKENDKVAANVTIDKDGNATYTITHETSIIPHAEVVIPATAPCIDEPFTEGIKCANCQEILKAPEPLADADKKPHTFDPADGGEETIIKEATCTEAGESGVAKVCTVCQQKAPVPDSLKPIPATGHQYYGEDGNPLPGKPETIRSATCTENGFEVTYSVCTVCGAKLTCGDCADLAKAVAEAADAASLESAIKAYQEHLDAQHKTLSIINNTPYFPATYQELPKTGHTMPSSVKSTVTKAPTCTEPGEETWPPYQCTICKEWIDEGARTIPALGGDHDWTETEVTKPATCTETGKSVPKCSICGALDKTKETDIPALGHEVDETAETTTVVEDESWPATCTKKGQTTLKGVCTRSDELHGNGPREDVIATKEIEMIPHTPETPVEEIPATCTTPGKKITHPTKCSVCGVEISGEEKEEIIPATGHEWGNFKVTEGTEKQEHPCQEGTAMGTATCTRCGHSSGTIEIVLPATAPHTWGAWTPSADGKTETRTCTVCGEKDERAVTVPDNPDDPDDPDNPDKPDEPDKPDPDASYTITLVQGTGGRVTASRSSAKAGTTVTITVTPESGYELDMVRVIGDTTAEDLTGGRRSFTMPASNVKVQASFARIASGAGWGGVSSSSGRTDPARTQELLPTQITSPASTPWAGTGNQLYWDIPTSHWAAGEINWANQMGYMSGSGGRFDPDGTITGQQVWMVMARLMGTFPANMAEARRWAVETGFATGSSPERAMTRHQVVTALYRCAILRGRASRPSGLTLAGYADSSLVPAVARDAMIWAVSNGIVTGDSSNRLNPTGTITRAQFAVLLYRFSQRV